MTYTPTLDAILATRPCYSVAAIQALLDRVASGAATPLDVLCSIRRADARWILARLLSPASRVAWAASCATRAKGYADAAADATAATADAAADATAAAAGAAAGAADAADDADATDGAAVAAAGAYVAAYVAAGAAAGAYAAVEHRLACGHALSLLDTGGV